MAHSRASSLAAVVRVILTHLDTKYVRARLNGPRQSLIILLAFIHSGTNRFGLGAVKLVVMQNMQRFLTWENKSIPSTSAIARALRKLKPQELERVIAVGLAGVAKAFGDHLFQHGYRLVAIDGVRLNTQRTRLLSRVFGRPKCGKKEKAHQPQALIVVARCVRTGVILAQEVVGHDGSERVCAQKMIEKLKRMGNVLVLLDRGFPSRDVIGQLHESGIKYIARMCRGTSAWGEIKPHLSKRKQQTITLDLTLKNKSGKSFGAQAQLIVAGKIKRNRTGKRKYRRSRSKRTFSRMLLLTNITGPYWSTERLIAIYFRRWDIETTFREDKRLLGSTRSRAKNENAFRNEIHALHIYRIIMALITAITLDDLSMPEWENQHAKRLCTTQLILTAWMAIEIAATKPPKWKQTIMQLINEMVRDAPKKRPGRSYERRCKGREGVWKHRRENDRY